MPRLTNSIPKYRRHRASGQGVVTLQGRDHYLGAFGTKTSKAEYDRLIGEWLANGRQLPADSLHTAITIAEVIAAYWRFARGYYVKNGQPSTAISGIKAALRLLRETYGHTKAGEFGPLALKSLQSKMIENGWCRTYANDNLARIKRIFKWAAAEELVPVAVYQAVATVPGLKKGRSAAPEPLPIGLIPDNVVEATLSFLPAVVTAMVRIQRLTGCRPGEVCILRPCDVDTSGDVWTYRPQEHKTEHHGRDRVIFIGPRAQDVLRPYLLRDKAAYCFVPAESERKRNARRREQRQTPMTPSQARRRPKRRRKRAPGDRYTRDSYRRALHRGCDRAGIERWSPNRLRHAAATEIRKRFGLEAAQVALGHASVTTTQVYAERDLAKAATIMHELG